jgi:hypothetical protein
MKIMMGALLLAVACSGGKESPPSEPVTDADADTDIDCSDDAAPEIDWLAIGPHEVGRQTHEGISVLRDINLNRLTVVYYPATEAGDGTPPATSPGGYPVVFFEHAGGSHYLNYDVVFGFLASHGLVIVSIDHTEVDGSGMGWGTPDWWDSHNLLFNDTIAEFRSWNETPGHPYAGLLDTERAGLAGHSHGSALMTMQGLGPMAPFAEQSIRAVALLAPCPDENMSTYMDAYSGMAPLQVIYGSRDQDGCVAYGQSIAIFEPGDQPSHFIHLPGGSHYGFTDEGALLDATITRSEHQVVASAGWLAWWKYTLEDDLTALPYLRGDRSLVPDGPEVHTQFRERAPLVIDRFDAPLETTTDREEIPAIVGIEGQTFINGFLSDTFVDLDAGIELIQREVETLLAGTSGTAGVLFFIDSSVGVDAYSPALSVLEELGEITLTQPSSHDAFAAAIEAGGWDLIVAATQTGSAADEHPYDSPLADWICGGGKAIVSDYRIHSSGAASVLACSKTAFGDLYNFESILPDGDLFEGAVSLYNPGWGYFSVALEAGEATRFAHTETEVVLATGMAPNALGHTPEHSGLESAASEWMLNDASGVYHPSWGVTLRWAMPGGYYRQVLDTAAGLDLTKREALGFRITQRHDDPLNSDALIDLHIRLVDRAGTTVSVLLSSARQGALRPNPLVGAGTKEKSVYETYRISLESFTDLDSALRLDSIMSVDWRFDVTATGAVTIDDVVFSRAGLCE